MRKEELYFESRDGRSRLHGVKYVPEGGRIRCIVQVIHGMAEYVERYEELARFLTDRGCLVVGEDHLGHGGSVGGGLKGYFCEQDPPTVVVRDVHRLKKMIQEEYPALPYILLGHSMGSFILRDYLTRYGTGIQGAIIMGTGDMRKTDIRMGKAISVLEELFRGGKHPSRLLNRLAFRGYNSRIQNPRTPVDWLSANTENVDRYMKDDRCGFLFTINGFQTLLELVNRAVFPKDMGRIPRELPLLVISGEEDPVGGYGAGVRRVYEKYKAAGLQNVTLKLYPGDRHEILNEEDAETVMNDIYEWMERNVAV